MQNLPRDQESNQEIDLDNYTDLSVGEILKRTRSYYGQSLEEVEINLRIRASQLDLLEKNDISHLPGRVYAIGFVRAYSEYLGLDGDKMVHLFKAQLVGKKSRPDLHLPEVTIESTVPNLAVILISLFGTILLLAMLSMLYVPAHHELVIPPVPERLKARREEIMNPLPKLEEKMDSPLLSVNPSIELKITQDSWIEVKDGTGKKLISRILKAGESYTVPQDAQDYTLSAGNAGGVEVYINGQKAGILGQNAQVKRNIALNPYMFKN
ncbi:MAG: DUF4115 domain-containing protein [Alphaproteobacteria bacterium]|nr:DUF4115 domain-containing protein [Alphaproteobacteria bacterium]